MNIVRTLVGDFRGSYATNDRIVPCLNQAQDEMIVNVFRNEIVNGIQGTVTLPAVASNVTSLAQYLNTDQVLEGLVSIISMRERPAGQDIDAWTPMTNILGDMPIRRQESLNTIFKWTGTDIMLIGATQALDIRIYGEFLSYTILSDTTPMIPGSEAVMANRAASILSLSRNRALAIDLEGKARDLEDELLNALIREKQNIDIHQVANPGGPFEQLYL